MTYGRKFTCFCVEFSLIFREVKFTEFEHLIFKR